MDKGYVQNTIFELLSRLGIGYEKLEHSRIMRFWEIMAKNRKMTKRKGR